jgi:hypothetical protein
MQSAKPSTTKQVEQPSARRCMLRWPTRAMTAQQDRRQALYDAYCAVPDHQRAEIIDGTLYVSPRLAPRHANASSVLGGELNGAFSEAAAAPAAGGSWTSPSCS